MSYSNPQDRKLIYKFGKELNFNFKQKGRKSNRDKSLIKLLKSPAIMASGFSITNFLPSRLYDLCNRLTLIIQETQARNNSNIINEEIIAIVDKLIEDKCMSKKEHK